MAAYNREKVKDTMDTQNLNNLARNIVQSIADMTDLSQLIDPMDEMSDMDFEYVHDVVSLILQRATLPPEYLADRYFVKAVDNMYHVIDDQTGKSVSECNYPKYAKQVCASWNAKEGISNASTDK